MELTDARAAHETADRIASLSPSTICEIVDRIPEAFLNAPSRDVLMGGLIARRGLVARCFPRP
jgi:hypothetical protein